MRARAQRQRKNRQVAIERGLRENLEAGDGEGRHKQIDQHEIGRKQPGRGANAPLVVVLDDRDVELARQKHDRERRQQRGHHPDRGIGRGLDHRGDPGIGLRDLGQFAKAVVEPPDDEGAQPEKRDQLDDRFDRDRENEAVLMLLGVDAPCAERHGEEGEQQGDGEIERGRGRIGREAPVIEGFDHHQYGWRDGFELERHIGRRADQHDERGDGGHALRFSVASGNEIGDRGDVLRASEIGDAGDERRAEADDENGADIDRQEIKPVLGSEPDRAIIGPGGAIDGQAQRIDDGARAAQGEAPPGAVAPPGDEEQKRDVADGGQKNRRAVHLSLSARPLLSEGHTKR